MPDGRTPQPGGWNRIHLIVEDLGDEVERLRAAGLTFRNDIISGPGGQQILLDDPAGQPDRALPTRRRLTSTDPCCTDSCTPSTCAVSRYVPSSSVDACGPPSPSGRRDGHHSGGTRRVRAGERGAGARGGSRRRATEWTTRSCHPRAEIDLGPATGRPRLRAGTTGHGAAGRRSRPPAGRQKTRDQPL